MRRFVWLVPTVAALMTTLGGTGERGSHTPDAEAGWQVNGYGRRG